MSKKPTKINTLLFCGAGRSWSELSAIGTRFRDRQHWILWELYQHSDLNHLFVLNSVPRKDFVTALKCGKIRFFKTKGRDVQDVYITQILPERKWLPWAKSINDFLKRLLVYAQIPKAYRIRMAVWCYYYRVLPMVSILKLPGLHFFDADHNFLDDPNQVETQSQTFRNTLANLLPDYYVVAGSESFLEWAKTKHAKGCHLLRNGIDPDSFRVAPELFSQTSTDVAIGYIGCLSHWIDFKFLVAVAKMRPNWEFVIYGDVRPEVDMASLKTCGNIRLPGPCDPEKAPEILASFDACMVLYQTELKNLDGDSMKIYEYLAAHRPVISTPYKKHLEKDFEGLVSIAETPTTFIEKIEIYLSWSEEEKRNWRNRVTSFLKKNTWAERANQTMSIIAKEMINH